MTTPLRETKEAFFMFSIIFHSYFAVKNLIVISLSFFNLRALG